MRLSKSDTILWLSAFLIGLSSLLICILVKIAKYGEVMLYERSLIMLYGEVAALSILCLFAMLNIVLWFQQLFRIRRTRRRGISSRGEHGHNRH
jgi:hypothetical protein